MKGFLRKELIDNQKFAPRDIVSVSKSTSIQHWYMHSLKVAWKDNFFIGRLILARIRQRLVGSPTDWPDTPRKWKRVASGYALDSWNSLQLLANLLDDGSTFSRAVLVTVDTENLKRE